MAGEAVDTLGDKLDDLEIDEDLLKYVSNHDGDSEEKEAVARRSAGTRAGRRGRSRARQACQASSGARERPGWQWGSPLPWVGAAWHRDCALLSRWWSAPAAPSCRGSRFDSSCRAPRHSVSH